MSAAERNAHARTVSCDVCGAKAGEPCTVGMYPHSHNVPVPAHFGRLAKADQTSGDRFLQARAEINRDRKADS